MGSSSGRSSGDTFADAPADLSHAGAIVDKAIEFMANQNISTLAVASALLGGALGMLARSLDDAAIIKVLENAIGSVRDGEMRQLREDEPEGPPSA
jgi:large-conductance mechanosensitive channel